MIDIGTKLRKAFFNSLNGNILLDGSVLPVVDEKLDVNINEHDTFIMFLDQTEDPESLENKTHFSNVCNLSIQVVNQRRATNTKEIVEEISNQILSILYPNRLTVNLNIEAPLHLVYSKYLSGNYNPVAQNDRGFVISKVMVFKNRVTHN